MGALESLTSIDLRSHAARPRNRLFDALLHFDLNGASDTNRACLMYSRALCSISSYPKDVTYHHRWSCRAERTGEVDVLCHSQLGSILAAKESYLRHCGLFLSHLMTFEEEQRAAFIKMTFQLLCLFLFLALTQEVSTILRHLLIHEVMES